MRVTNAQRTLWKIDDVVDVTFKGEDWYTSRGMRRGGARGFMHGSRARRGAPVQSLSKAVIGDVGTNYVSFITDDLTYVINPADILNMEPVVTREVDGAYAVEEYRQGQWYGDGDY